MMSATLRIFSGRPDPTWILKDDLEPQIRSWLATLPPDVTDAAKRVELDWEPTGYRGICLRDLTDLITRRWYVPPAAVGLLDKREGVRIDQVLFDSMPEDLRRRFRLGPDAIETRKPQRIRGMPDLPVNALPRCGQNYYVTTRNPWNRRDYIDVNRCYGYAANVLFQHTTVMPLEDPADGDDVWTAQELLRGVAEDAFEYVGGRLPASCPLQGKGYFVAACLGAYKLGDPITDIHFFRLDADGTWSHKPGDTRATVMDDSRHTIRNLAEAEFAQAYTFCGFLAAGSIVRETLLRKWCPNEGRCPDSDCPSECGDVRRETGKVSDREIRITWSES
jgi:hypothetical protein